MKPEYLENPSYGAFSEKTQKEILQMVDWCLEENFIKLECRDGFPLLVYAERGLAIDVELAAHEFLDEMRERGFFWTREQLVDELPHRTLERLLELMKEDGLQNWEKVLKDWHAIGTKRMKGWIEAVRE